MQREENTQQLEGRIEELSRVDDKWCLLLAVVMMLAAMALLMLDVGGM